jgi:hypothetical protein
MGQDNSIAILANSGFCISSTFCPSALAELSGLALRLERFGPFSDRLRAFTVSKASPAEFVYSAFILLMASGSIRAAFLW